MLFYDMEVYFKDWLGVFLDTDSQKEHVIVNDPEYLRRLYEEHKNDIWCGFNINHYDQYIVKAILLEIDPKYVNDRIIEEHIDGWQITHQFRQYPMINYDLFLSRDKGLKTLEGFMGSNIKETDVDFNIRRKLTDEEIEMTIKYCRHDVEEAIKVFMYQINEFHASMGLIKAFPDELSIKDLSKTKPQLSAKIIGCERTHHDDEFEVFVLDCIDLKRYKAAKEFFLNEENHWYKRGTKKNEFKIAAGGLEHTLGWGGIHAAKEKPNH